MFVHQFTKVLRFLRQGVQDLLNASRVVDACGELLHWNNIRLLLERARMRYRCSWIVSSQVQLTIGNPLC